MSILEIHDRLADTSTLFVAALGLWALFLRWRAQPLDGNWMGGAVVGELLLIAQGLLGSYLYVGLGLGSGLPRPFMHILYGVVAVITLPAAYSYFGQLEDEKVKTVAMAAACFFLWGIVLRASHVTQYLGPTL